MVKRRSLYLEEHEIPGWRPGVKPWAIRIAQGQGRRIAACAVTTAFVAHVLWHVGGVFALFRLLT